MNRWALIRKFPKLAIVAGIWIVSFALFGLWWFTRSKAPEGSPSLSAPATVAAAADDKWVAGLADRMDRLFLADGDLYDSETGELVQAAWLKDGPPPEIYFDRSSNRLIGRFERGLVRYALSGEKQAELTGRQGISVSTDFKTALYAREGDMWRAEIDWDAFTLKNERQVTKFGNLRESFLMQGVLLASDNFLVLRYQNQLLRVNLETGGAEPTKLPLNDLKKGRSPDGAVLMGNFSERGGRKLFAYDVEKDDATMENVGRSGVNDYQWLSNDRCLILVGGDNVMLYDRKAGKFEALMKLPFACQRLGGQSPGGRFAFAQSRNGMLLIDTVEKGLETFQETAQQMEWVTDDSMLLSADVPSSELRGTWFKKVGEDSTTLAPDPFFVTRDGVSSILIFERAGWVVFGTKDRFYRSTTSGESLKELSVLRKPYNRLQAIGVWPPPGIPRSMDGK